MRDSSVGIALRDGQKPDNGGPFSFMCSHCSERLRERDPVLCRNRLIGQDKKSSWKRERGTHPRVKRIYFEKLNKTTPEKRVRFPVHLKLNEVVSASSFFSRDAQRQITSFSDIKRHIWCANAFLFYRRIILIFIVKRQHKLSFLFQLAYGRMVREENQL